MAWVVAMTSLLAPSCTFDHAPVPVFFCWSTRYATGDSMSSPASARAPARMPVLFADEYVAQYVLPLASVFWLAGFCAHSMAESTEAVAALRCLAGTFLSRDNRFMAMMPMPV